MAFQMPEVYLGQSNFIPDTLENAFYPAAPRVKTRRQQWLEEAIAEAKADQERFELSHFCFYERSRTIGKKSRKALVSNQKTQKRVPSVSPQLQAAVDGLYGDPRHDPELALHVNLERVRRLQEEALNLQRRSIVPISGLSRLVTFAQQQRGEVLQRILEETPLPEGHFDILYTQHIGRRDAEGRTAPVDQIQVQWDTWETNQGVVSERARNDQSPPPPPLSLRAPPAA